MTLQEFINRKPKELRLGQHFVNRYWSGSDIVSRKFYQLDGESAETFITTLMIIWQWDSLPDHI